MTSNEAWRSIGQQTVQMHFQNMPKVMEETGGQPTLPGKEAGVDRTEGIPQQSTPSRLDYLDGIRGLLCVLVVVHHIVVTYGPIGSWYYVERKPISLALNLGLGTFVIFNQFFFMGFFFFLAGCFTPSSLERKGFVRFAADRLWRLGMPLFLFAFLVNSWTTDLGMAGSRAIREADVLFPPLGFPLFRHIAPGPLWFVETLLVFSMAYAILRSVKGISLRFALPSPSLGGVAAFSTALAAASFLIRFAFPISREFWHLQLGCFPQYVLLFLAGLASRRGRFLEEIPTSWFWPSAAISLLILVALPLTLTPLFAQGGAEAIAVKYRGGPHWPAAALCLLEAIECPAIIVTLLLLFRDRWHMSHRLCQVFGQNSYATYCIHAPVLVAVSIVLRSWEPGTLLKIITVCLIAVPLCVAISHWGLRRIPGVRSMFG